MRNLVSTAIIASVFGATAATAGGLAAPTIEPTVAPVVIAAPAPVTPWAGGYLGAALTYGETELTDTGDTETLDGVGAAIRGGYDWQFGSWVLGLGAEYAYNNEETDIVGITFERQDSATAFARVGYAMDTWLPYVSAGYTWSEIEAAGMTEDIEGATYGIGIEKMFTSNVSGFAEYSYTDFDEVLGTEIEGQGVKLGMNFRF